MTARILTLLLPILTASVLFSSTVQASNDQATIAVAANFRITLEDLIADFQVNTPEFSFQLVSGSTGMLFAQIRNGAPYDLFFAADAARPEQLERDGVGVLDSVEIYALGQIAVWVPNRDRPWKVFFKDYRGSLAIANPTVAPYGLAAQHLLETGLFANPPKLIQGTNVHQAFQFVDSGNVQVAMTSLAQVIQAGVPRREYYLPDLNSYPRIVQKRVLLSENTAAKALLVYLRSASAQRLVESAGYTAPAQPEQST